MSGRGRIPLFLLGAALGWGLVGARADLASATNGRLGPTPQGGRERRATHPETGRLAFIGFDHGQGPTAPGFVQGRMSMQTQAQSFLSQYATEFGVGDPDRDLRIEQVDRRSVRYRQVFNGVPVVGGELVVSLGPNGDLASISGEVAPDLSLGTEPSIAPEDAATTARQAVAKWHGVEVDGLDVSIPELWVLDEELLEPSGRPPALVWWVVVTGLGGDPIREYVFVDAVHGSVPLHWNQIDTSWSMESAGEPALQDATDVPTETPTETWTETPSATETPAPTETLQGEPTETPSESPTIPPTATQAIPETSTPTASETSSPSETPTPSVTPTASETPTPVGPDAGAHVLGDPWLITSSMDHHWNGEGGWYIPGALLCTDANEGCTNGIEPQGDAAHQHAADTYDFYAEHHARDSLNGRGTRISSVVRYGRGLNNAYYENRHLIYGDASGFAYADDVAGHELTHGVTEYESNLFYYYQSGAINESFSDIWGEFVDLSNGTGNDSSAVKWLVGEDITDMGAVRSLSNPPAFGDPDKINSGLYYRGASDNGGVHTNSGVNNKAAYLMTDGGTFNGYTVRALGLDKVAAIYYEAQTNLLTSGSDYYDLYYLLFQACQNVIGGADGVTASDCLEVRDATNAVGMNLQPAARFDPEAAECDLGTTRVATLFWDDLETGLAYNWAWGILTGYHAWGIEGPSTYDYSRSGRYRLWGNDMHDQSDSYAQFIGDVFIQPHAFLRFDHSFDFDPPNWDGGVLEYTIDGGATWIDARPLFRDGRDYNGTIADYPVEYGGNTLGGRAAFVGASHGYVSSRYDLSSLAGQSARFRWRLGTDWIVYVFGWSVDDVEVYTCIGAPGTVSPLAPPADGLTTDYTPTLDWSDAAYADHYDLQVATDSGFATLVLDEPVTLSAFTFPTDLSPNTTYWWRTRAVNVIDQAGNWTAGRKLRTAVEVPDLLLPGDSEALLTTRPTFDWTDVDGATSYTLQVSKSSTFGTSVVNVTALGSTYALPTDLSPRGSVLYWRARANATNGPSSWSTVRTFVSADPPSVPVPNAPAPKALVRTYSPVLTWEESTPLPDHYQVQLASESSFASIVQDAIVLIPTYTVSPDLAPNQTYWWRVRSFTSSGQFSSWSPAQTFRTVIAPPTGLGSADAALTVRPTFDWGDVVGSSGFTLQVSQVDTFATTLVNVVVTPSIHTVTVDLPRGVTLFARVRANGTNGPSDWTPPWSFTSASPPGVPSLSLPATNALTQDYTPALDWADAPGAPDHYRLQVSRDAGFADLVEDDATLMSSDYTFPLDLTANTTYWWRVQSFNAAGQYSLWSVVRTFRTAIRWPSPVEPSDGSAALSRRPPFRWTASSGATSYTLQVSTADTFATTVVNATVSGAVYTPSGDLPAGVTLYWRARANGTNGPSAWSPVWAFTSANPPGVPGLVSPASNALMMSYTPTLDWSDAAPGLDHYQVQVAANSGFISPVVDDATVTSSTYTFGAPLDANTTYWWRVRSYNGAGQYSLWSAVRSFRTVMSPPALTSPSEGELLLTTRPTFDWGDVAGKSNYTLQVSTAPNFASTAVNTTVSPSSYTMASDLTPKGSALYWRVRANGTNGPSPWSETRSLTSANPPAVPGLTSPANGALVMTYTPTLDWGNAAPALDHYQLQIAADSGFGSVVTDLNVASSIYTVSPAANPNATYWWRVRSWNAAGQYSQWSAVRSFRTALLPPALSSPSEGELLLTTRPTFDWGDVAGKSNYTLQVSTASSFVTTILNVTATSSTYTMTKDLSPKAAVLYWRVRANGTNGPSAWSPVWAFTSANPPSVPGLVSPASNALMMSYTPTLDWSDAAPGLDHYQLQVAPSSEFSAPVVDDSTLTSSIYTFGAPLDANATYWWRVRAYNGAGQYSLWSAVRTFRTVLTAPTGLASADAGLTTRPTFVWSWSGSAPVPSSYTLQVSTLDTFVTTLVNVAVPTTWYTMPSDLPRGATLHWRVRANSANGPSLWAPGADFLSADPPSVPALILPSANALVMTYAPMLDWGDSTGLPDHYQVQIATNPGFGSVVQDVDVIASAYAVSPDLDPNLTYWWRVRSWSASGEYSLWAAARTFRTVMVPPEILVPAEGNVVTELRPALDWDDVDGATSYTLQISANVLFTSFVINVTTTTSAYTPTVNLPADKVLEVRVRANGPNGPSPWSPVISFIIIP